MIALFNRKRVSANFTKNLAAATFLSAFTFALLYHVIAAPGLFEFGDATFPLHAFPADKFLPWDGTSNLGYDNVFTGVPRVAFFVIVNALLRIIPNPSAAQALFYVLVFTAGAVGAFALARRNRISYEWSLWGAVFFTFNPWTSERLSQAPLIVSAFAIPWALIAIDRSLRRPSFYSASCVALTVPFLLCALQIFYLFFFIACIYAVAVLISLRKRLSSRWALDALKYAVVVAFCAFFSAAYFWFPAVVDVVHGSAGSIQNVAHRASYELYRGYDQKENWANSARLLGFLFSPFENASDSWRFCLYGGATAVVVQCALFWRTRRTARRTAFWFAGVMLIIFGLLFATGPQVAPAFVGSLWYAIPGMRGIIDPDYFMIAPILGAFFIILTIDPRRFRLLAPCIALLFASAFFFDPDLQQKAIVPTAYLKFAATPVRDARTLWFPGRWVTRYRWSPYVLSGWPAIVSPQPVFGSATLEISPQVAALYSKEVSAAIRGQDRSKTLWLLHKARADAVLVSLDLADDPLAPLYYDELVDPSLLKFFSTTLSKPVLYGRAENPLFEIFRVPGEQKDGLFSVSSNVMFAKLPGTDFASEMAGNQLSTDIITEENHPSSAELDSETASVSLEKGATQVINYDGQASPIRLKIDGVTRNISSAQSTHVGGRHFQLLPNELPRTEYFRKETWPVGACDGRGPVKHPQISFKNQEMMGISYDRLLCASSPIELHVGRNQIRVVTNDIRRAMVSLSDGHRLIPLEASDGHTMQLLYDCAKKLKASLFVYFQPNVGEVVYHRITIVEYPPGIINIRDLRRLSVPKISVKSAGLHGFEVTVAPHPGAALLFGHWTFDRGWQAFSSNVPVSHVLVDGYGNGWLLGKAKVQQTITIRYRVAGAYIVGAITAVLWFCLFMLARHAGELRQLVSALALVSTGKARHRPALTRDMEG